MSVYTIRPSSQLTGTANYVNTGSSTDLTAVNDNSDTTYIRKSVTTAWIQSTFELADPSIAAGEVVDHVSGFVRYKGTNNKVHSVAVYHAPDGIPSGLPSFYANSSSAVTVEPGWAPHTWSVADLIAARLVYSSEESSADANRAYIYELGGTVYTVAPADVSASARTETSSVYASIPISVQMTIDAWAQSNGNIFRPAKSVVVDVQVEAGGSGVNTGTIVSRKSVSLGYGETGTYDETVTLTDPLANGTYNVYVRGTRSTTTSDATFIGNVPGSWSAAAVLTMQAAQPLAPTLSYSIDPASGSVAVGVTPNVSDGYINPIFELQRSDNGLVYRTVRGASAVSGSFGVESIITDFEASNDSTVAYTARVTATNSGVTNTGPWSAPTLVGTLPTKTWNLKCPEDSVYNVMGVNVVGQPTEDVTEDIGIFRPLNRRTAVAVAGSLSGWDGELDIRTNSSEEWSDIKKLIESQKVLLLESPFGWRKYIRISSGAQTVMSGTPGNQRRSVKLSYVECDIPWEIGMNTRPV